MAFKEFRKHYVINLPTWAGKHLYPYTKGQRLCDLLWFTHMLRWDCQHSVLRRVLLPPEQENRHQLSWPMWTSLPASGVQVVEAALATLYTPKWIHSENTVLFLHDKVLAQVFYLLEDICYRNIVLTLCFWRDSEPSASGLWGEKKTSCFGNNNGKSFPKKWVHFPMDTVIGFVKEMISSPYLKLKAFLVLYSSGKQYLTYANSFIIINSWTILELQS